MQTLQIRAEESVIQQILSSLNSLNKAGSQVKVLEYETSTPDNSWDDILQNEQLLKNLRKSIAQAKKGELISEEETFKQLFDELDLNTTYQR